MLVTKHLIISNFFHISNILRIVRFTKRFLIKRSSWIFNLIRIDRTNGSSAWKNNQTNRIFLLIPIFLHASFPGEQRYKRIKTKGRKG